MQMIWLYNLVRTEAPPKLLNNNHGLKFDFSDSCFVQYFNYIFKKIETTSDFKVHLYILINSPKVKIIILFLTQGK